jgi:hypothetical protein
MSLAEVVKRLIENLNIYCSRIKYRNPAQWPYSRFYDDNATLALHSLPGIATTNDWKHYRIYNAEFDLTKPLDWYFSDDGGSRWPACHYAKIDYRPGNPYGDVRINWELNRLQFLPAMAVTDEDLAKSILKDWLEKNPYLHGPGYLASMEVALRWFSIYWAVCLFKKQLDTSFLRALTGLAVASGKFIEGRLSTHSSAGNHLIIEAAGLYWLGKALENNQRGVQWISKAREILWEQIIRQVNPDGSNQEQSFWYHGFVLDALFHYLLLEDRAIIPAEVLERVEKMLEFVNDMTLPDGSFPDYGDRDDGFVFRLQGNYHGSPFPDLLNLGTFFFDRPEWHRGGRQAVERLNFWTNSERVHDVMPVEGSISHPLISKLPVLKTYKDGGMTLMRWGKGRLLFRHAPLGLGPTYGHGHADALSILFSWGNVPVLIDLGSGQYNGDQAIRNFFRSTIAHNTVEIGGKSQARMLGPFMWEKSYETNLEKTVESPVLSVKASHNGYMDGFSVVHTRKVEWLASHQLDVCDSFSGPGGVEMRGAFHLGACQTVTQKNNVIEVDFGDFMFLLNLPSEVSIEIYYGSKHPFIGWRSTIYGKWEPIHSVIYSRDIQENAECTISLRIIEK